MTIQDQLRIAQDAARLAKRFLGSGVSGISPFEVPQIQQPFADFANAVAGEQVIKPNVRSQESTDALKELQRQYMTNIERTDVGGVSGLRDFDNYKRIRGGDRGPTIEEQQRRQALRMSEAAGEGMENFYGLDAPEIPDDTDGDGGIGAMLIQLANMQRNEARRRASDAEDYVKSAADMTLDDFKLLRKQSKATTDRNKASAMGRLNDGLESMGINTANAADSLADIGIDAQKTAEEVGGQTGAALYTIYNMGADLADNLAAISMETLDTAVSQVDNALAGAIYNISNNLSASLAQIDQALLAKQISGAEAAQAALQAEEKAKQEAQLDIQLSKIIGDMTNMDPLAAFAADRLGINFSSLIPEPPEIPEPSYTLKGQPIEVLQAMYNLINPNARPMSFEDLFEDIDSLNQPQE